jgi:hypothetical protein
MPSNLFFGLEFEFYIGYARDQNIPVPDLVTERTVHFNTYQEESPHSPPPFSDVLYHEDPIHYSIFHHVRKTLESVGLAAKVPSWSETQDTEQMWRIGIESLREYKEEPYFWAPCEVASPVFRFEEESFRVISKVCEILERKYIIRCRGTLDCGLHVHISEGFDPPTIIQFQTMQRLIAFLWAFEPQLDTLHPEHRQYSSYCRPSRQHSPLSVRLEGLPVSRLIAEGISEIKKTKCFNDLLGLMFEDNTTGRSMAYNFYPAVDFLEGLNKSIICPPKPTVEFRQHSSSINAEEVINWTKLLCGIIQYCQDAPEQAFNELTQSASLEQWQKENEKEEDGINEKSLGPTPAQGTLTVIDLLHKMSLGELANFYHGRTFPLIRHKDRGNLRDTRI